MIESDDIRVYYHCFYVVEQASQAEPALFYPYWDDVAALLNHTNSYHRDFALILLANLAAVDSFDRIAQLLPAYLARLNDDKLMTARCCVRNSAKIIRHKPALKEQVLTRLLSLDSPGPFPHKQQELLKADVLAVIAATYPVKPIPDREASFIRSAAGSSSPTTRKRAKELLKQFDL